MSRIFFIGEILCVFLYHFLDKIYQMLSKIILYVSPLSYKARVRYKGINFGNLSGSENASSATKKNASLSI